MINGKEQEVDKNILKQIFTEHWEEFKEKYPRYQNGIYETVISKMLGCGDKVNGYSVYRCEHCGEPRYVPFSCKSSFCLSCAKVYVDNWVSHISKILFEGVYYRHIVLTVPEALRKYFYKDQSLLSWLMKTGVNCLKDVMARTLRKEGITSGFIVVLQTGGRSGTYNPHLHILMTSGGLVKENNKDKWVSLRFLPYELLHKKWQYYLFKMVKEKVKSKEVKEEIDFLYNKYKEGLVAYIERGNIPKDTKGLAIYLAKYVVSPPMAIRRIISYDGEMVRYWYKDHKTGKRREEKIDVLEFIGRMVQHILPKGFQRIRYCGLHLTCSYQRIKDRLSKIIKTMGRGMKDAYQIITRKSYRERIIETIKKDPFICPKCGSEMILWEIWHPKYGVIFNEFENIKAGKYERYRPKDDRIRDEDNGDRGEPILQLWLSGLQFSN